MKKIYLILLLCAMFAYVAFNISGSNVSSDERTYDKPWRDPTAQEVIEIGKLMMEHQITVCGGYRIKEVMPGEYVVACTEDGRKWNYFVTIPEIDELFEANANMSHKLKPPYEK